jgi:hypothetical protein
VKDSLSSIQDQLTAYSNQIREYLNRVDADIENYKFAVEKTDDGLKIEVMFKGTLSSKDVVAE